MVIFIFQLNHFGSFSSIQSDILITHSFLITSFECNKYKVINSGHLLNTNKRQIVKGDPVYIFLSNK